MQAYPQLIDEALEPIHHGLTGFDRRSKQWPSDGHDVCAQSQRFCRVHASANTTRSDQRDHGQSLPPAPATSIAATGNSPDGPVNSAIAAVPMPWPTSLSSTGYSNAPATWRSRSSDPEKSPSPSRWTASCSGLVCTASASAPTRFSAFEISSTAAAVSCARPILPNNNTSGATSRTVKLDAACSPNALSSMIRCEPSIIPMPSRCAASARFLLIVPDSSAPPVIAPTRIGARKGTPRKLVDRSTWARLVCVSALYGSR